MSGRLAVHPFPADPLAPKIAANVETGRNVRVAMGVGR